jgi:2Fe-2S ferredoxin
MPKVHFVRENKTVDVALGKNLLDIALENDIDLDHACGGYCACCTCRVMVTRGLEGLDPRSEQEEDRLAEENALQENVRLACQTQIKGDVEITTPAQ